MTNKNLLIFLGLALIGYMLYRKWQSKQAATQTAAAIPNTGTGTKVVTSGNGQLDGGQVDINLTLYKGVKAKASVKQLQAEINQFLPALYPKLGMDGDFGDKTYKALKNFWDREQVTIAQIRSIGKPPKATMYDNTGGSTSIFQNFLHPF